ncbi:hypothetical protein [Spirochaeta isovalerica]|uniref:Beta-lactamase-inhibitor-like PepSY-like domain-containing protein n=1 Tax=Spirochaeta isovalerica TaxID=150 RepID=A0A841RDY4_9SPIO|nr:hypothetical protein [Spirochaeta isovalerica]MBB6481210.1 hypothetical protein [Spirochaeta isovalerica]
MKKNFYLINLAGFSLLSFAMEIEGEEWKIGGELSPGAFALTEEMDGELVFYVNNFRVNTDESIWSYTDDSWDLKVFLDGNIGGFDTNRFDLQGYIAQLISDPDLDALRPSVLDLDIPGSGDFEPRISVGRGSYSIEREENRIRIFMMHNGGVEIVMEKRGE